MAVVKSFLRRVSVSLALVCAIGICLMMLSTVADVSKRYIFGRPIAGTIDFNELLMVFAVYLGLGYAYITKQHVRMDFFLSRLKGKPALVLDTFCLLLALGFMAICLYATLPAAIHSVQIQEYTFGGLIGFPVWPARVAIPIGLAVFALVLLQDIIGGLYTLFQPVRKGG